MRSEEDILRELRIEDDVLAIFAYGSHVYGTATHESDEDYIIVMKSAFLKDGSFKMNAISNSDRSIQGIQYSRSGFIDAINNYDISALECLSLPSELVIKKKWPFKIQKWQEKEMVKKLISKSSNSFHIAGLQNRDGFTDRAKKGVFHALRILTFGLQLKVNSGSITDYSVANNLKNEIDLDTSFDTRSYIKKRDTLIAQLRQ